ncbi:MAG: SDR family oxidoreductase [Acidianus infernus]|nr:SDR family oxidoreductase [Acidianus infernus]
MEKLLDKKALLGDYNFSNPVQVFHYLEYIALKSTDKLNEEIEKLREKTRFVDEALAIAKIFAKVLDEKDVEKEPQDIFVLADVSRAPLIQLAKILSKDYGKYNITFNVILMGSFNTPGARRGIERLAKARKKSFEEVWKEEVLDRIPLGRIGDPEKDLGKLILFLYDSDYITGTSILIDGGNTRAV